MASDLQLGQKLGMSLDELIKKTQASKKKAPAKPAADKKKPGNAKKAAKAKPAPNTKGKRQNKPAEHQTKSGAAIKKNTAKKPNRANASNRASAPNAPKRVPTNPRSANRNAQPSQTRVGDLLNMNVAVSSKKDAQAAMKIAKQLEAEARKFLGPPARQQQQQQPQRAAARPQQRQGGQQRQAPQQRRAPYNVPQASYWPEPQTENFLADPDRMSDRDSEQMEMDEQLDLKPNLASLQAQANQFARGVRGQARR